MTLSIHHVSFERNNQYLLNNINLLLQAGTVLHIQGANGSGKSTLLRIIAGYISLQEGLITWNHQCIRKNRDDYQQQFHYIGHQNGIKPQLTVYENLQLLCALRHYNPQKIDFAINYVGLKLLSNTLAMNLSAGQARRVALARLLLHSTPLWILDEPTTALDYDGQQLFNNLLKQHVQQKGIAILTTHHDLILNQSIETLQLSSATHTENTIQAETHVPIENIIEERFHA
jgi:heme exporter protein A